MTEQAGLAARLAAAWDWWGPGGLLPCIQARTFEVQADGELPEDPDGPRTGFEREMVSAEWLWCGIALFAGPVRPSVGPSRPPRAGVEGRGGEP